MSSDKLNHEEFVKMAILKLRDVSKSRGIHSVFSGFNDAFRKYFGEEPVKVTQDLASSGKIETRFVKRGVMIYLPGEAPGVRGDVGSDALAKILNQNPVPDPGLEELAMRKVVPEGVKCFPKDFLEPDAVSEGCNRVDLPGTRLDLEPNSQTVVVSPKRHFRYAAKNPAEAKFIVYAHKVGQRVINMPNDSRIVFRAVSSYEKYCQDVKCAFFEAFLENTHDEEIAEHFTRDTLHKLGLWIERSA